MSPARSPVVLIFVFISLTCSRVSTSSDLIIKTLEEFNAYCSVKPCIMKCCPENLFVGLERACVESKDTMRVPFLNFAEVNIYDKNIKKIKRHLPDVFRLVPSELLNFTREVAFDLSSEYNNYLMENGNISQELPNSYNRWKTVLITNYCVDYALPTERNHLTDPEVRFWTIPIEDEMPYETDLVFVVTALLISSIFLVLVLIVYSLLPDLRNLCGMILMAYVASLLAAFIMLSTLQMITLAEEHTEIICRGFTYLIYFFFLSSFCWMNVMSFDIWWTFRGYAKARPIHRRGECFKFCMYCLYAWGLPLAMTIAMGVLDNMNLKHIPWFIQPKIIDSGCFIEGGGKFVYLYVPMLTMIVGNWMFFLMTAFNIWRLSRGTAVLNSPAAGNPSAHRTHRHRFMLYLKLSVIMGMSWVLEVASFLAPEFRVWYLTDAYNLLIGVSIFLIFVCKKKIFRKLSKRLSISHPKWSPYSASRSNSCSSDSDASQDTTTAICSNPTGITYSKR